MVTTIMAPVLPILSILGYWAIILGTFEVQAYVKPTVDSEKLAYGWGMIYAAFLFFGVGNRGRSYSNFLASTVSRPLTPIKDS